MFQKMENPPPPQKKTKQKKNQKKPESLKVTTLQIEL